MSKLDRIFCLIFHSYRSILTIRTWFFRAQSLCNACGIRSRKKRRSLLGLNRGGEVERKNKGSSNNRNNNGGGNQGKIGGESLKWRSMAFGRKELMQRTQLGEEEQAAVLLMALSYGSVYA